MDSQQPAAACKSTEPDSGSEEISSESENFMTKGAFLLTPASQLQMERIALICEKMNYKSPFSLTKTATGILFKFADVDDYLVTHKKTFQRVIGSRIYKKIPIPCRPQNTFTIFVFDIPEDVPVEDIRHSLYKFRSVLEVCRLPPTILSAISPSSIPTNLSSPGAKRYSLSEGARRRITSFGGGTLRPPTSYTSNGKTTAIASATGVSGTGGAAAAGSISDISGIGGNVTSSSTGGGAPSVTTSTAVRITLASLDECNSLLKDGLDFYGATYFPTEPALATAIASTDDGRKTVINNSRLLDMITSSGFRIRDLLPVFDYHTNYSRIPKPITRTLSGRN